MHMSVLPLRIHMFGICIINREPAFNTLEQLKLAPKITNICLTSLPKKTPKSDPGTVKVGTKDDKYLPHLFTKEKFNNV